MKSFLSEGITLENCIKNSTEIEFSLESVNFTINASTTNRIKAMTEKDKNSVNNFLFTAFCILLFRYTREEESIIENVVQTESISNQYSYAFVKSTINEKETFRSASLRTSIQINKFSDGFNKENNYHNIIFDTLTLLNENPLLKELKFGIWIRFNETSQGIKGRIEFNASLFDKNQIEKLSEHFMNILKEVTENPEIKLCEIDMLSEEEKKKILIAFNDTKAEYPKDKTICEYFEEQVRNTPDNAAVAYEGKKLTYKELNEKANQLARVLRGKGVKTDTIVGIMVERSLEMMVGIMGILKAGGAYLPISPDYPDDRIKYMLEDSKTTILLTQKQLLDTVKFDGTVIALEDNQLYQEDKTNLEIVNNPNNLAYIIYTSGSTGKPKGVMIQHGNVINLVTGLGKIIYDRYAAPLNVALIAPYVFDASVKQIFASLLRGNCLYIVPEEYRNIGEKLTEYYIENSIDISDGTPSHFKLILSDNREKIKDIPVKHFIIGGEELSINVVQEFLAFFKDKKPNITNIYGPTECCVDSTAFLIDSNMLDTLNTIPIGRPLVNYNTYIVNKDNKLQPVGVAGELCIAGAGLARGYLNKPEMTEEKFVANPFDQGKKMYKTGDLARWLPDGNIEFLGRIDYQVKIRGYRIELGEIENQLLKNEAIKEAVVLDKQDGQGNKYLCAYIVSDREITVSELRKNLSQSLPDYMIPTYFVQIEKIPLTLNGKINRKALPEPDGSINTGIEYVAATNEIEKKLVKIWNSVLEVDNIGINDDFFTLGGHSLKAIKIVSIIQKELMVEISVGDIFSNLTIRQLGEYIGKTKEIVYSSIETVEERELYEVSSAQKRMFALNQFSKKETNYNIPHVIIFQGKLEKSKLEESFKKLIERHEAFRTSFELANNEIMQRIHKAAQFKLEYEEINTSSEDIIKSKVEKFIKPFDLSKAPLLRVKLIRLEEEKHVLMFDMHHIISDGTSVSIIMEELTKLYKGESLEELRVQYKDYSAWENKMLASEGMKKHEEYWTNIFSDEIPVLNLSTDYPRPSIQSFEGESIGFTLDKTLTEKLNKISKANGATLYMTLLAAYNILLSKYSGQEDIVVGSAAAGRLHVDLQNMVGMFVNTLALRNYPEGKKTFKEFLQEVKKNALNSYENQDYQFDTLVEKLCIKRDLSRNALFDTMFVLQNTDIKEIELSNIRIRKYEYRGKVSSFDITLEAEEKGEEIKFNLEYCTKLFKRETIERIIEHFKNIIKEVAENPRIQLCEIDTFSEEEKRKILVDFNSTKAEYPKDTTIYKLFEEQVERTPDNIAVVYKNQKLTYRELNKKANSLARRLKEKEVKADSIVGIMSEGSVEMLIGILGILKAGAAYLPIDPKYPVDRIGYMLEDSRIRILLTDFQPKDRIGENTELILLKDEVLYKGENTNLEIINTSKDIAYIIYTSGSSGKPKGVMIEHSSLINLSKWHIDNYEVTERDNSTKYAGFGFDASVWEIFPYIITGAAIHVIDEEIKLDLEKLNEYYNENKITISFLPTQICEQFMRMENKTLRYLLTGGDKLRYFEAKSYKIVNNYGPTENTVVTTSFAVDKQYDNIPIGKPIANTQIYILDNNNMLLPIGIPGELCIGGESLARGYLNNTELTAEKFIENPFAKGQRLYKTGDLARWLPDGNIEFLGRIDYQIKIRGFRIELGEIESSLLKLTGVKEAAVIDREKEGNKYLCAYLVSEVEYSARNLREELKKSLPDYMIPSYFITLLEMPLNQNGKIDRKALPIPDGNIETGAEYIAATNDIEEKLISIWSEVLGVGRIGINDNFFELGGHSLKAIKIVSIIQKELMVEVSIGDIFSNPTVGQLGEYIGKTKESIYSSIEAVEERALYEVSSAQKRMFALNQFSKEETNYNVPYVLILEGKLDKSKVEESLNKLVQRHEAFRTSFELVNEEIMQRIHEAVEFNLEYEEINTDSEEIIKSEAEKFIKPFDLSKAPLLRVKLVRTEEEKYVLMFDMHHIISDGISMNIIMEEFTKLYKGESLETLRIQYKDYSAWENIMLASEGMKNHEEYWTNILSDEIPVLNLPTDYLRPSTQSFEGESISFKLDEDLTHKLKEITKANGATLYMTLLSTYNILLSKYSGQEDIIVGSPIAGRPHADLYNMVGMFVNTLVMRNYPEGKKTFNEFLQEVKRNALGAYENQDYQFDKLVEKLDIRRDLSRNALFDTMFTLQNTENKEMELDNVRIRQLQFEVGISKFDINLSAEENGEEIEFNLKYCTKLFKRETIERLVEHFKNILKEVAENPTQKLSEINIFSEEEKQLILGEFNNTKAEYPKDKTLYQLFEEQASKTPDNIAAIFEEEYITYRELDAKANQLARVLREKGVKADSIVAMSLYRSIEMTIGIMAIQKAGGAYLPISPEYPEDRISYMLEDSNASVLLTQSILQDKYQFENTTVIAIDSKELYKGDNSSLQPISGANNLAYVIYTSGSTGKPKGAMIEHHSAINRIKWMQKRYPIGEKDVILQKTPYTFDVSVWELFWWSMEGARVCFLTPGGEKDPEEIVKAIEKHRVTTMHFVPSMLNIFLEYIEGRADLDRLSSLKQVFSSGEALTVPQVERFNRIINSKIGTKLINLYGPTEATVDVSYFDCSTGERFEVIPIGKPIDNISLLVVDKYNNLLPVGVPGELCISGVGVGRGYLNRPELTAEKFIQNPHISGERMYRTGDLTKWMPDGNIEYLGRIDNQVKIRGFRIELGEIENELLKHSEIKEAIVIDKEDKNGNKYLCGYIVAERELTVSELKEHLLKNLPDYMVPAYFITMDKLPLSANGKADRKALPELETGGSINTGVEYAAPTNKIEEKLVSIWSEVLGVGRIGINDNFFDLGGHSLKAIKIVSIIQKELMVEVSVGYIFSNPTVNQIGKYIEKTKEIVYSSIEAVEERELYEVSSAQKRMFALNQFSKKEINYNIPSVMILEGKLEKDKVEESFNKLVERHEAFRTSFELVDNEIMQRIHKAVQFKVEYEEINKFDAEGFVKPFDLSKAPLLRVKLIRLEEEKYVLMFDMHHIISDGISMSIIMEEFTKLYKGKSLETLRIQYKDYSAWENKMLTSEGMKKHEEYWTNIFSDEIPILDLPTDYPRPSTQSFEGESIEFTLDKSLTEKLNKIGKANGATLYMTLLTAYNILLSKYSGQEDIVIGSPIAGRPHADLYNMVGMFINTLVMRNYPGSKKTFNEFLQEVKKNALNAYENQDYQFDKLVEKLDIRRDLSRNALFDTMFILQNTEDKEIELDDVKIKQLQFEVGVSKFDITLSAKEKGEEIKLNLEYCTKLFKRKTIERVIEHFKNILKEVAENPTLKLCEIDMLLEEEKKEILIDFNDTKAEYPKDKTIHELFEEQVIKTPDKIALVFEDKSLTYKELNEKSNRLGRALREKGVKQESIVGIMVERSLEMIIGIMGILKAGGAYLPIDPEYPVDRIKYILEDSKAKLLLTQSKYINKLKFAGEILDLDSEQCYKNEGDNLKNINSPENLAYIIYTSGSTGNPKGVMIEHGSAVNTLTEMERNYPLGEKDVYLLKTSYTFDVSVTEIFGWFVGKGKLAILKAGEEKDIYGILNAIEKYDVTHINFVPSMLNLFLEVLEEKNIDKTNSLKYVFAAGEALIKETVNRFHSLVKTARLENIYGPTETTIYVTKYSLNNYNNDTKNVPIGKPLSNIKAYIINESGNLQPVGVQGELCFSGVGLSRGYLNKPELTAEKFIENPFDRGERIYKTGDLARWQPDGNIEFLGRIDHQVKIRGFRIELGEIESQLLKYEGISEVIVIAKEDNSGNKYLCGYICGEREYGISELREYLAKELPEYMIPSYFIQLDKLPLTANGKIDRKALPVPDGSIETGAEYIAATNEIEEKLISIWRDVLGVEKIGINDNFFELGGHSLKAIKIVSIIQKELMVEISVGDIFSNPTVRQLGAYIGKTKESVYSAIEVVEERKLYEVSSAQKRMYALNQFSMEETNYNIPSIMILEGKLEKSKLEESFNKLVERHEAFRTSFELVDNEIMQRIHEAVEFKVEYEEINTDSEEIIKSKAEKFIKPFDLSKAPLLRVKLIRLEEEKYILMFDMHHIISDGESMSIIMEEFTKLYKGESLEELRIQYKDYSAWENKMLTSEGMKKHEEYWINRFGDEIPVLDLPTDYPRPNIQSFEGESIGFTLDKSLTEKLNKIGKANGATLYMTLLTAYNIMLSKYSGQVDIVVGSPIAGRVHADLYNMVGMFVNTLVMRNYPEGKKTFNGFLQEVKKNALNAYENQDYQFDKLVEKLDIRRDLSRNALFDTMFTLQNTENKEMELDNVRIKQLQFDAGVSKFDIALSAEEKGEEIELNLRYCTKLFKRDTIERVIKHFKNILKEITENPALKLCEIDMLSEEEKKKILIAFNDTMAEYPKDKTICEYFEEQVRNTPDNAAVAYEGKKLTYKELNEKANQLARVLRGKGVKTDTIVGIMVERSLEMMVGIMGILKCGGAYLPISPDYPDDRIKYMLEDSKTTILLTQKQLLDTVKFDGTVIALEDNQLYQEDKTNLEIVNNPNNLAYIIYTSGSTGRPKGVMIQHGNVINLVTGLGKIIYDRYAAPLNVALIAPYVFDASVKQIFASLLRGNCLYIVPEEYRNIGEKLTEYYIENSIDISDGTPSHFKLILGDNIEKIKYIPVKHFIIGGEALPVDVVQEFLAFFKDKKPNITNIYGPTECCVDSTAFLVDSNQLDTLNTIPIGRPLVNYNIYVLDKYNKLQPIGVAGELCIAGAGLARGYLNKPEMTEEKFVANPFEPGKKMYKTGDLVKWLPDGDIEFLGRIDHQVKIRGYRIEIGEIESVIKSHSTVQDSIVIVHTDNTGDKALVAYIVPKTSSDEKYSEASLKEYLKKQLPKYMVPTIFVQLESMPINTNGKIDRFALPKPDMQQRGSDESFVEPRNKEEIEMAQIWAKTLGIDKIGIDDDFFDLGGDSFKAIKLARSISSSLGVMELFKNPTIRELVAYLSKDITGERTILNELTKPIAEKDKAASIICFPFGGGSAISYQPLANALPKNYSLYSVELPGHDYSRPDEELASIEDCAERCLKEIIENVKGPIVIYGHCLGATMAAFLAYKLEEAGIQVDGVFVAAMFPAPRITNTFFKIWDKIFPNKSTDKGNRDMMKTLGGLNSDINPEETEFILRNLMHDSTECIRWYTEVYNDKEKGKFKPPITCIVGEGDRVTEFYQERYKEWEHFSDNVDLKTIKDAGHFFFKNQAVELAEIIKEKIDLWQGRSSTKPEAKKIEEAQEDKVKLRTPDKKQVVPSMSLFMIVAIVQIISEIGTILSTFGSGIWVYQQTNALSQFAMMLLFRIVPTILILPISGAIVDRFDRRLILIAADILSAICSLGLIILLYNNGLQIWQVYAFTVVASVASSFRQPAYMAAITQITPKMYLAQANSVSQFSIAIGGILASICGGVFFDSIGFKGLVTIDLITFIISIIALIFIKFPDTMFARAEETIRKQLMGGWNFIIRRKSMVVMVIFFLLVNFLGNIFDVIMTPLILTFGNASMLGFINAFSGIGVLSGAIVMLVTGGTKKRAKGMVGFVIPLAISVFIAGIRPLPVFSAIALFGVAFSITIVNIHWQSLIQVKVGLELQGRVFAVNRMLVAMLTPLSYVTAGVLADKVFAPMMQNNFFNSSIANLILGAGVGREMRLNILIAGAILFVWGIIGFRYKQLSEMDDILEDANPGEVIIKDKDKLQQMYDGKIKVGM